MWIPKWVRDRKKGVDSPVPTQAISNEELVPRPQTKRQRQVEELTGRLSEERSRRTGVDRRDFVRTGMGMATAFMAANKVYGNYWEVDEVETLEPEAYEEKWPKSEYFIMDVQTHFTNGWAIGFRNMIDFKNQEFVKNMGFKLDKLEESADSYAFPNFVKELYLDSETSMVVISGVPGRENQYDRKGNKLDSVEWEILRKRGGGILPSWLMSMRKKDINEMAGSVRALCQGNCAPNHYWDKKTNTQDKVALFEQMEREVKVYGIDSWKWYCHTDPGRSGDGFQIDDEKMTYPFYEKSKELGVNLVSIHKGFSFQSKQLGHLANPKDVEKAALDHPDLNFVVYHSAMQHNPSEPDFEKISGYDPTTGDFSWHDVLMDIKIRNPEIDNVYCEIGSSFGLLAIMHPVLCQHLIGRNVKVYGADHVIWGTDCLWWGSPQWVIEAFKRFQISDELCEKFGYAKLTKEDKAKIFGLNAAKLYGIDPKETRKNLPKDALEKIKMAYLEEGGKRDNSAYGWVRDDTRRV
jgi:predicted TIM-barrel fold metal-dependent hydrolase